MSYFVRPYHPSRTWVADDHYTDPAEARIAALKLSRELSCEVAVSCCARNAFVYGSGKLSRSYSWESFYTGDAPPEWEALRTAI